MNITRRNTLSLLVTAPTALVVAQSAFAATPRYYSDDGVAVDGSDVVAYFREAKPVRGVASITHDWDGVAWRFSTRANRDAFAADPTRYAPQYGGYCAWAVSKGYTASTTPAAWKIVDAKLYLNYSRRIQRRWERDIPSHIAAGDANWPGVLS